MATTKVRYNQIKTGLPAGGDVNYNDVSLLLNMEGSNGSTTFADGSSSGHSVTANGNASISTSEFKFGSSSAYFDGSGDYLSAPSGISPSGTDDFTVEYWIYVPSAPSNYTVLFANATSGGLAMTVHSDGTIRYGKSLIGVDGSSSNTINFDAWNHIVLTRESGTVYIFINGSQGYSASNTSSYNAGILVIGADGNYSSFPYTGYIDEFRITKGIARYTSNFSVPTAAFPAFESKEGKRLIVNANESIELES